MLKRTYGRLLLALLVITGLAGKINDTSLTKAERKTLVSYLKDTRSDVLETVKGLSDAQLNYKASADRWSISECVHHIALTEKGLWDILDLQMKEPAAPEKRTGIKVTDDELLKSITDRSSRYSTTESFQPGKAGWKNTGEALNAFKDLRNQHLRYARTSTEDFRNRVIDAPFGKIDAYQFMLFVAGHTDRHVQQMKEVMSESGFPKK